MNSMRLIAAALLDQSRLTHIPQKSNFSDGSNGSLESILTIVYTVLGIIAVVMLIIAGIMYATSNGDPSQVARAKNTILYTIVGIVVLVSATAIIGFVMRAL